MIGNSGRFFRTVKDEQGAIIALVTIMMIAVLGFAALAVDLGHLYMVKNELQNAADAGALAGASVLYNDTGAQVNGDPNIVPYANQVAYNAATSNSASILPSGRSAVLVNWTSGTNEGDVQRGHYSSTTGEFTRTDSLAAVDLPSGTEANLDTDTNFINAIQVITRTSTRSLFASFLGISSTDLSAKAVAYIGFAKQLNPHDVDEPIAICQNWLYPSGSSLNPCNNYPQNNLWLNNYWMVPDSSNQVARWITLNQDPLHDISCGESLTGNTRQTSFVDSMDIMPINSGGAADSPYRQFWLNWRGFSLPSEWPGGSSPSNRCAMNDVLNNDGIRDTFIDSEPPGGDGVPERAWELTLPVIDCTDNPTSTPPLGRVKVRIIWMTWSPPPSAYNVCSDTPGIMYNKPSETDTWTWRSTDPKTPLNSPPCFGGVPPICAGPNDVSPACNWCSFAVHFRLRDYSGQTLYDCNPPSPPPNLQNVMFIKPVCEDINGTLQPVRAPTATTGSHIYGQRGQLAKYPVLVK